MTPASLKAHRETLGYTPDEMAKQIGVGVRHLRKMERGEKVITETTAKRVLALVSRSPRLSLEAMQQRLVRMEAKYRYLRARVNAISAAGRFIDDEDTSQGTAGEDGEG